MGISQWHHRDPVSFSIQETRDMGLPSYPNRNMALAAAKLVGWNSAIQVVRKDRTVWMVGEIDLSVKVESDIPYTTIRLPVIRELRNASPPLDVLEVRRFKKPQRTRVGLSSEIH